MTESRVLPSGDAEACGICGAFDARTLYAGPVRRGRFGSGSDGGVVVRCGGCGVARLVGLPAIQYEQDDYRVLVDGSIDVAEQYRLHDADQIEKLTVLGTAALRGEILADIGAGVGSFLDHVRGLVQTTIAVEPAHRFQGILKESGHEVYASTDDACTDWAGTVDTAVCFSVLEHVEDPVALLSAARKLLKPSGRLLVSTPNLEDWLLELLPKDYASFFYRVVHRWYFDAAAMGEAARLAGFTGVEIRHVHRFDLSNLLVWLRDRRPSGRGTIAVDPRVDAAFVKWLEASRRSDYLYAELVP